MSIDESFAFTLPSAFTVIRHSALRADATPSCSTPSHLIVSRLPLTLTEGFNSLGQSYPKLKESAPFLFASILRTITSSASDAKAVREYSTSPTLYLTVAVAFSRLRSR